MRYLLPLLLLLGGCGGCAPSHSDLRATALRLEFERGLCSGTALGPQTIITATHCLQGDLRSVNGAKASIASARKEGRDTVILTITGPTLRHFAKRGPRAVQGQTVRFFGNPGGNADVFRKGYVVRAWTDGLVLDMPVCRGDSGAGILDDQGRVVGVVSAMTSEAGCHFGISL